MGNEVVSDEISKKDEESRSFLLAGRANTSLVDEASFLLSLTSAPQDSAFKQLSRPQSPYATDTR